MELILMVNLAFSIVGFFFIFRMWREVKERRDEYGENFNIPRASRRRKPKQKKRRAEDYEDFYEEYEEEQEEQPAMTQDDVKALQMLIQKAQAGEV